ncbi:hypothetical protein electrica_05049 [Klebsiella electrica]|nr:hypothetical protein electrica_05049 [Klebsiella electrica]
MYELLQFYDTQKDSGVMKIKTILIIALLI